MNSSAAAAPLRVSLDVERVDLTRAKTAKIRLTFPPATWEHDVFLVVDVYAALNPIHPEGHAGWWKWTLADREEITLQVHKSDAGLAVRFNGQAPTEFWVNEDYDPAAEPVLALHVVLRQNSSGSIVFNDLVQVFNDKRALEWAEDRRNRFATIDAEPLSIPWYHWPRSSTVRIVAANIFERDAVGNFAIGVARLLQANGIPCQLYASQFEPALRGAIRYQGEILDDVEEQDLVWMNFSIYDPYLPAIADLRCRKLLYYHNITPPNFFQIYDAEYAGYCAKGLAQLIAAAKFDAILANSRTTARQLRQLVAAQQQAVAATAAEQKRRARFDAARDATYESAAQRKALGTPAALAAEREAEQAPPPVRKLKVGVCPPILGQDRWGRLTAEPVNLPAAKTLLLYVGRIAPNKRIEDLLALFAKFHALDRESALLIVGGASFSGYSGYLQYLLDHEYAAVKSQIHFLSVVSDEQLKSIYAAATAFVTMSAHEGFCVPLVEAMAFDLPIFAAAEPGVAETLGDSGRRYYHKDFAEMAADLRDLLAAPGKRAQIVAAQRARLAELLAVADGRPIWSALEEVMFTRARPV
ncbi:MAG: glycosyltransferase [Planctomycetaceae bacterium]|nr:glycosyltransferase [Planctomycetaceae bacterium]